MYSVIPAFCFNLPIELPQAIMCVSRYRHCQYILVLGVILSSAKFSKATFYNWVFLWFGHDQSWTKYLGWLVSLCQHIFKNRETHYRSTWVGFSKKFSKKFYSGYFGLAEQIGLKINSGQYMGTNRGELSTFEKMTPKMMMPPNTILAA